MTWKQFQEWQAFEDLEPFEAERADYHSAHVVQTLWNIARDSKKHPKGWPLKDFILSLGDIPRQPEAEPQSLATQELLIDAWIAGSNAILATKAH